ncbi:MAG: alpha/beta fold hydrolase [Firmicutes bacterium]|nr:alpha/beta fold hydrolase [Bacillota bacterium]
MAEIGMVRRETEWRGVRVSWFEAGQGPAVILLHGGGGTGKAWQAQMQALGGRYRVLAPDMPGFGRSDWVEGVRNPQALGTVIWAWADTLWGVDQVVLGGNSMGGRVALAAALERPARVRALVLLDAVGVRLPEVPVVNPLDLPPGKFVEGLVYDPAAYRRRTPYRTLEDAQELARGRESFRRYVGQGPITFDPDAPLDRLTMPALLIWGREDRIVPLPYGQALAARLPRAELVVLDHCGHLPHIEAPELVNGLVRNFLDRLPA